MAKSVIIVCETCGKEFRSYPSNERRFCAMECVPRGRPLSHGGSYTRLYQTWLGMKSRCNCPTAVAYDYYGGRGIRVCGDWNASFSAFHDWAIASGYEETLEIDRIDVDGNYEPSNCRWATRRQQMQNTRKRCNAKTSSYRGVSWCANAGQWRAQICTPGRSSHIGLYRSEIEAARAYDAMAMQLFGEFARLNFARQESHEWKAKKREMQAV